MTSEEQVQKYEIFHTDDVTTQILVGLPITHVVTIEILLQLLLQAAQFVPVTVIFN